MAATQRGPSNADTTIAELVALDQACTSIFTLSRDGVLQAAARLLTEQLGFSAAWLGELCDDGGSLVIRHTSGNRTDQFLGLAFRSGRGLGGKVFAGGRVQWVDDYFSSRSITHDYDDQVASEGILRMIAAPMVWEGRPIAVLFGASRDCGSYGDRAAAVVEMVANRAAAALIVAQRLQREVEIAVSEERRRMARQLNNGVAPMLVALSADARKTAAKLRADGALRDRLEVLERQASAAAVALRDSLRVDSARPKHSVPALIARREYDVLRRVATGDTNAQIADELGLSLNTIKTYLRNVMIKLGARNRVEAISRAQKLGLL